PLRLVVAGQTLAQLAPARDPASANVAGAPGRPGKDGVGDEDGEPGEPGGGGPAGPNGPRGGAETPARGPLAGSGGGCPARGARLEGSSFRNAEAELSGELVPLDALSPADRTPKRPATPPVAKKPEAPPPPELTQPRVVLQARVGHSGGNPVSLALNGKTSLY